MDDYDDITNMMFAGDIDGLEEAEMIVEGFPLGKDTFIERHWITNAIDVGTIEVVRWMLSKQVNLRFRDDEGYTVLHSAIDRDVGNRHEVIRLLIAAGADVNAHGTQDWTPAHMAAVRNDIESLRIFVESGADLSIRTGIDWYATPLEECEKAATSPECLRYLQTMAEQSVPPKSDHAGG